MNWKLPRKNDLPYAMCWRAEAPGPGRQATILGESLNLFEPHCSVYKMGMMIIYTI